MRLLAEDDGNLVELELVEDLLVQRHHVFVDPDTIDEHLNIEALHVLLQVQDGRWLRRFGLEGLRVILVDPVLTPCVLSEKSLV